MLSWSRTSASILEEVERRILSKLDMQPEGRFISAGTAEDGSAELIWTISLNHDWESGLSLNGNPSDLTPLVLLHGMGAGVALWLANLPAFAADGRPIFALDLLGFGRSSRPSDLLHLEAEEAEKRYVEFIENWRVSMKLESMILLGHSFGGYLASAYSLKHPERIRHLILADSWGYARSPSEEELAERFTGRWRFARYIAMRVNPFGPLRAVGPIGPWMMTRIRPDLVSKFEPTVDKKDIAEYLYHCNAQSPSGEVAFKSISLNIGWARYPMIDRIGDLPEEIPMTMIHGEHSWIDSRVAQDVKRLRAQSYVHVKIIREAGHHVYVDVPEEFNRAVVNACQSCDSDTNSLSVRNLTRSDVDNISSLTKDMAVLEVN